MLNEDTAKNEETAKELQNPPGSPQAEESAPEEQMCCDGKRTAAEHRSESSDGKCCSDS